MQRWLMKFELESKLGIEASIPVLSFIHPLGIWEIYLQNYQMESGCKTPILFAHILFNAVSLDAAESIGEKYMIKLIDYLTFTTRSPFHIKKRIYLFDWTPKTPERIGYLYRNFPDPNYPQLLISEEHKKTVETILMSEANQTLAWALHKFASGVSAYTPDAKFELFWFTIETIAVLESNKSKVSDRCAVCKEPLFCSKCNKFSEHRPYPSQLIEQLFVENASINPKQTYEITSKMRNALLHGEDISEVEKEVGTTLPFLADIVGNVARACLISSIEDVIFKGNLPCLEILDADTFFNSILETKMRVRFMSPNDREPEFSDIPEFKIDLIKKNNFDNEMPTIRMESD